MTSRLTDATGAVLVVVMMALLLMSALGAALVLTTASEGLIAANFRDSRECLAAADAALERALPDLDAAADWNAVLGGAVRSAFVDGAPDGPRVLADGSTIDLAQTVNMADCAQAAACTGAQMDAVTVERPWGANNPRWQLYLYGRLADLLPGDAISSPFYVVAMVADDPSETDGDPLADGSAAGNPGSGILAIRVEAFGSRGSHSRIDATVERPGSLAAPVPGSGLRLLSWREVR